MIDGSCSLHSSRRSACRFVPQALAVVSGPRSWLLCTNRSHLGRGAEVAARWRMWKSPARQWRPGRALVLARELTSERRAAIRTKAQATVRSASGTAKAPTGAAAVRAGNPRQRRRLAPRAAAWVPINSFSGLSSLPGTKSATSVAFVVRPILRTTQKRWLGRQCSCSRAGTGQHATRSDRSAWPLARLTRRHRRPERHGVFTIAPGPAPRSSRAPAGWRATRGWPPARAGCR